MPHTELHSLIPVCMILTFTQGHRVIEKLELAQSFCFNVALGNPNVCNLETTISKNAMQSKASMDYFGRLFFLLYCSLQYTCINMNCHIHLQSLKTKELAMHCLQQVKTLTSTH